MADETVRRDHLFSRVFNFRDVGGHTTEHGRTVRWRRLFRSDSLGGLADADRQAFSALGVRTVLDLRRPYEVARDGRVPEWDGLTYRHVHPEHREWDPYDPALALPRYLADRYLDLAEEGAAGLVTAVGLIADERSAPIAVHCVAGKDRTGVVCALTLSLLGVSDRDIAADYALSTAGMRRYLDWLSVARPDQPTVGRPPLTSPPEAMTLFLQDLRARYGSVERYLTQAGLAPEQITALREHLLS